MSFKYIITRYEIWFCTTALLRFVHRYQIASGCIIVICFVKFFLIEYRSILRYLVEVTSIAVGIRCVWVLNVN